MTCPCGFWNKRFVLYCKSYYKCLEQAIVLVDKTTMKPHPNRPIAGGTSNNLGLRRYDYWRTGYGPHFVPELDFCVAQAGEYHCKPNYATGSFEHTEHIQLFYHITGEAQLIRPKSFITWRARLYSSIRAAARQ